MEKDKSIDRVDIVLGLLLDSVTMNCPNQVVIDEQVEYSLKEDNKQNVAASKSAKETTIKKGDVLTMIWFLHIIHISYLYWVTLGQFYLDISSLLGPLQL